jgi:DNA-binding protein Fis
MKRAALSARTGLLTVSDLELSSPRATGSRAGRWQEAPMEALDRAVEAALHHLLDGGEECRGAGIFHCVASRVEQRLIAAALDLTGNNQVAAARMLQVHRTTLRKKLTAATTPSR